MATASDLIAGRYRVSHEVGSGGMASVVVAEDTILGRRVAIKRLHAERVESFSGRFRREARIGASISHPNLVAVYDVLPVEDDLLLVMEYVEGQTLADALRDGPLDPRRALDILEAAAAGLDHLHERGVIHRDIKPSNILLGDAGTVKLADLGIATAAQMTRVTQAGAVLGTARYLAPELFAGDEATPASDIYALAAVAFEALSGRKARGGDTPLQVARSATQDPPPYLLEAWPQGTPEAARVLCRGMASDPADRPRTAGQLVRELAETLAGDEASASSRQAMPTAAPAGDGASAPSRHAMPTAAPASDRASASSRQTMPTATPLGDGASAAPPEPPPTATSRPPQQPPPTRPRRTGGVPWLIPVAMSAIAGLVVLVVLLSRAGGGPADQANPSRGGASPKTADRRPAAGPSSGPAQAVQTFYTEAAADRYGDAWALAGPGFRNQLGGFSAFRAQFGSLRSIRFARLSTIRQAGDRATVAIRTTALHSDHVDRCSGTVDVVRGTRWLIDHIAVAC